MAIIGSVILDQVMFKEDVEKHKIESVQLKVNEILPIKTRELTFQINQLDSAIKAKEAERALILADYNKNPMISAPTVTGRFEKDTTSGKMVEVGREITTSSIQNPKAELIVQLDAQLKAFQEQKTKKENEKLNMQQVLEDDLNAKVGFLDELTILFSSVLLSSGIALTIWILLFLFFLSIELFVLVNKYGDTANDYDKTILHQMAVRIQMLENMQEKQGMLKQP
jgi:type III secretory pathway component EscR